MKPYILKRHLNRVPTFYEIDSPEMPKALFDSKYLDLLIAEYRENPYYILMGGLDYVIDESVIRTARETDRLYRYDTGEELTVETLFPQGYDLDTVVRNYAVEEMVNYYSYTLEEAQLQAQGLYYALEGVGLRIVVPHMGEENYLWMPLNNFDASLLNVWR